MVGNINRFYTYIYKRPDGTPFYVGKGTGDRYLRHLNKAKKQIKSKLIVIRIIQKILKNGQEPIIEKLIDNVDEELAFFIEQECIDKFGRINNNTGILANLTDGGEGSSGYKCSKKTKEKLRAANIGKKLSIEHKNKISKTMSVKHIGSNNPFYGKKHSKESLKKISESSKSKPTKYWLDKKFSEEHLEKLRIQKTCPHCGKIGRGSAMNRYHFDNCRSVV